MSFAASSHTDVKTAGGFTKPHRFSGPWPALFAGFTVLTVLLAVLALLPDGVGGSAQTLVGWLLVGMVAAVAVTAVVRGLERLLDCDAD